MKSIPVEVLSNIKEARGVYRLVLEAQVPMDVLDPGCFFMVRVSDGIDPLLRRPLGIFRVGSAGIEMLYQVRGKGTELLSRLRPGQLTDIVGPLGHGWMKMDGAEHILLVAGGMGMAPLYDMAMNLRDFGDDRPISMIWGHKDASTICCLSKLEELKMNLLITTEDGSEGMQGKASDFLEAVRTELEGQRIQIAACGPYGLLKETASFAANHRMTCQVSLEAYMGCGMGACQTCVVPAKDGENLRVCQEGPVFWAQKIDWEAIS